MKMENLRKHLLIVSAVGIVALVGCSKSQTDSQPAAGDTIPPTATDTPEPAAPAEISASAPATNTAPDDTLSAAARFAAASQASPFAQAELGLKESYNRALIAYQIGDYARAVNELRDLAATPDLSPEQKQAVQDLLAKTLKQAPELAATNTLPTTPTPTEFPLAAAQTAEPPKNLLESPFSTADPAIKESFARAKAAFEIGNYDIALAELQDLATNAQLNWQQKYAVQELLAKTPQPNPATQPAAPAQPPNR